MQRAVPTAPVGGTRRPTTRLPPTPKGAANALGSGTQFDCWPGSHLNADATKNIHFRRTATVGLNHNQSGGRDTRRVAVEPQWSAKESLTYTSESQRRIDPA